MKSGRTKSKQFKRQETYNRALRVLAKMRRTGAPLNAASREEHIDPRTVRKYLRSELKAKRGYHKTKPTKNDRRRRRMLVPTARGNTPTTVVGSKNASLLGKYMSAVGKYLHTGNADALGKFKDRSIGGHPLITDPEALTTLAEAGALTLDQIYALPESSS